MEEGAEAQWFDSAIFSGSNAVSFEKIRLKNIIFRRIGQINSGIELEA